MARRFGGRRRKPRVVWFPTFGNSLAAEGVSPSQGYHETDEISVEWNFTHTLDAFPLTWDESTSEQNDQQQGFGDARSLQDYVSGKEYRLRRVLGRLFLGCGPKPGASQANPRVAIVELAAGLIVGKTDDTGALISSPNPLRQDHATYPWIWHRKWLLRNGSTNQSGTQTTGAQYTFLPGHNALYTSYDQGPYFDQKTARVIKQEERLFMMLATRMIVQADPAGTAECFISVDFDYRLLGSLRAGGVGNRRNASR